MSTSYKILEQQYLLFIYLETLIILRTRKASYQICHSDTDDIYDYMYTYACVSVDLYNYHMECKKFKNSDVITLDPGSTTGTYIKSYAI